MKNHRKYTNTPYGNYLATVTPLLAEMKGCFEVVAADNEKGSVAVQMKEGQESAFSSLIEAVRNQADSLPATGDKSPVDGNDDPLRILDELNAAVSLRNLFAARSNAELVGPYKQLVLAEHIEAQESPAPEA